MAIVLAGIIWWLVFGLLHSIGFRKRSFSRPILFAVETGVSLSLIVAVAQSPSEAKLIAVLNLSMETVSTHASERQSKQSSFQTVAKGFRSDIRGPLQITARSQPEWNALWAKHASVQPTPPPPAIDFDTEFVAAIFLGEKPTGGHEVEITRAERNAGTLTLSFREKGPRPDSVQIQALTQPYHIVRLPSRDGETVVFRRLP